MEIGDKLLEIKWEIQIEKEIYLLEVSPVEAAVVIVEAAAVNP